MPDTPFAQAVYNEIEITAPELVAAKVFVLLKSLLFFR